LIATLAEGADDDLLDSIVRFCVTPQGQHLPAQQPSEPVAKKKRGPRRPPNPHSLQSGITKFLAQHPEGAPLGDLVAAMRAGGRMKKSDTEYTVLSLMKRNPQTYHEAKPGVWILMRFLRSR